jgi:hypothetical protein
MPIIFLSIASFRPVVKLVNPPMGRQKPITSKKVVGDGNVEIKSPSNVHKTSTVSGGDIPSKLDK